MTAVLRYWLFGPVVVGVETAGGDGIIEHADAFGERGAVAGNDAFAILVLAGGSGRGGRGDADHPGHVRAFAERAERTALRGGVEGERAGGPAVIAAPGEKLDRPGERARAVERALRTALDLDAAEAVAGQVGEVELPGEALVDGHAVDEHLGMAAFQAAREHAGQLPGRAGLRHADARHRAQGVGDAVGLALGHLLGGDDRHLGGRLILGQGQARGGNDDRFGLGTAALIGLVGGRAGRDRRGGCAPTNERRRLKRRGCRNTRRSDFSWTDSDSLTGWLHRERIRPGKPRGRPLICPSGEGSWPDRSAHAAARMSAGRASILTPSLWRIW